LVPSGIYLLTWICLLAWAFIATAHKDHQDLLARIRALNSDKKALKGTVTGTREKLDDANQKIADLERQLDNEKGRRAGPQSSSAKLLFSFTPVEKSGQPVREITLPLVDGKVTFTFYAANQSGITASRGQLWFRICVDCKYTYGPEGFTTLPSASPGETTYGFNQIFTNSYVVAKVGVAIPSGMQSFEVGLRYACETCESDPEIQRGIVHIAK
jgi:hypothetical protein